MFTATVKTVENANEFGSALIGGSEAGNIRAARKLRTFARQKVNRRYVREVRAGSGVGRDQRGRVVEGGASRPGEPPKRRSGRGRLSIDARLEQRTGKGEPRPAKTWSSKRKAPWMSMWEFAPEGQRRPWMAPAFMENKDELQVIMLTPVKRRIRSGGRRRAR